MSSRTWARLVAALGLAAVMVAGTAGPAGAEPGESHGRVRSGDSISSLTVPLVPQPGPDGTSETDQPATPETDQLATPEADQPVTPETDQPATPEADQPAAPEADQPAAPETDQPIGPKVGLPAPTDTAPQGAPGPHAAAPTVGLRLLADALTVSNSSVTLNVNVPPGIITSPTEISVLYGVSRVTVQYNSARGTYIDVQFPPKDGAVRTEHLAITLTELTPERYHYSIVRELTVAPRFEVSVSPLVLTADYRGSCDVVGSADPTLVWMDPAGMQHREDTDGGVVDGFAGSWSLVAMNSNHRMPTLSWIDRDAGEAGENLLTRRSEPMLPLPDEIPAPDFSRGVVPYVMGVTEELPEASGDDCSARLSYRITYVLRRA